MQMNVCFGLLDVESSVLANRLACDERLRNDLFCVEWDVKAYLKSQNLIHDLRSLQPMWLPVMYSTVYNTSEEIQKLATYAAKKINSASCPQTPVGAQAHSPQTHGILPSACYFSDKTLSIACWFRQ